MNTLLLMLAVFLLANLLAALLLVVRGPTAADRLLAALLFGTTGVAVLLLMAFAGAGSAGIAAGIDIALVLALLAAVTGVAFAQRAWRHDPDAGEGESEHGNS